ncbi:MAG: hypothetical protein EOQ99_20200 [Mesorhizobium sp.]|nr:MAG: hypothetical protein EOQ99_20200 [Mesorhizobium sp.]
MSARDAAAASDAAAAAAVNAAAAVDAAGAAEVAGAVVADAAAAGDGVPTSCACRMALASGERRAQATLLPRRDLALNRLRKCWNGRR